MWSQKVERHTRLVKVFVYKLVVGTSVVIKVGFRIMFSCYKTSKSFTQVLQRNERTSGSLGQKNSF